MEELKKVYRCFYTRNIIEEYILTKERVKKNEEFNCYCKKSKLNLKFEAELKGWWKMFYSFEEAKNFNIVYQEAQIQKEKIRYENKMKKLKQELKEAKNKELK
jgi:hypothetical protein